MARPFPAGFSILFLTAGACNPCPVETTLFLDIDRDGWGSQPVIFCGTVSGDLHSAGLSKHSGDCDDNNPQAHPNGIERCNDIDDDCDQMVDESSSGLWYLDADMDTYGDDSSAVPTCKPFHIARGGDCDDFDGNRNPGASERCNGYDDNCDGVADEGLGTYYVDGDGDGYGDPEQRLEGCHPDQVTNSEDCDDETSSVHPGAPETCDGIDNDCDGVVDDVIRYEDRDGDGWGNVDVVVGCDGSALAGDCDDLDPRRHPDVEEVCDGIDNDCNALVDDGIAQYHVDADGDGFGDPNDASCDPDHGIEQGGDCVDDDPTIHPDAIEICDGVDQNCDDGIDEGPWYVDTDGDGYAGDVVHTGACSSSEHSVITDCDDEDDTVHPDVTEDLCDGYDSDCDGSVDEDAPVQVTYTDADGDGYHGTEAPPTCDVPEGHGLVADDCDDTDIAVNPAVVSDTCDGVDSDCDGAVDEDLGGASFMLYPDHDGDGFGSNEHAGTEACEPTVGWVEVRGDCDDDEPIVHPGATETCNAVDDDCNGTVDDVLTGMPAWYADADGDGFGGGVPLEQCDPVSGHVLVDGDCDESDPAIHPDAPDYCDDGLDSNCDGIVEDCAFDGDIDLAGADLTVSWGGSSRLGAQIHIAGDVLGDGGHDLVVAALDEVYPGTPDPVGAVIVFDGDTTGLDDGSGGIWLHGTGIDGEFGSAITGGDLDHDGFDDLVIGAPGDSHGEVFLFHGPLVDGDAASVPSIVGEPGDFLGSALASGGDANGDGLDDLLLGAPEADRVVLMASPVHSASVTAAWLTVTANPGDDAGRTVALADVDGSGLADLVIGAPGRDVSGTDDGAIAVFLDAGGGALSFTDADVLLTGRASGSGMGHDLDASEDVDGDGRPDIAGTSAGPMDLVVWSGLSSGTHDPTAALAVVTGPGSGTGHTALADLEDTGTPDLVATFEDLGDFTALVIGPLSGSYSLPVNADATLSIRADAIAFGELDAAPGADLVVGSITDETVWVFHGHL